jgi:hypothetical protein
MKDYAAVSGNTASSAAASSYAYGGGVSAYGKFTMSDNAVVSGNTASSSSSVYGGGVYIVYNSQFSKSSSGGVIIYGKNEGTDSNAVKINGVEQAGKGAAIYARRDSTASDLWRDTTVGATQDLSIVSFATGIYTFLGQWTD